MMKYKYYIIPTAREEFRLARDWYSQQQAPSLSNKFAQSIKDCIVAIRQNPFVYAVRYKNVRIAHTTKFPYAVHFYLDEDLIIITAIIYQGRNPIIAQGRI